MKDTLFEICVNHIIPSESEIPVVLPEPYVPFIPDEWNKILVLAESQNLSQTNSGGYVNKLRRISTRERIFRLGGDSNIGVHPWDDGSLKLAIESSLDEKAENTAVSNAVLWSQIDSSGNNINPSDELINRSIKLWAELLPIFCPIHIVTCGRIAQKVIDQLPRTIWSGKRTNLRLPSRAAMSRVSNMFTEKDLLSRYFEVKAVVQEHPEWAEAPYRQNEIFFACHAVSIVRGSEN